MGGEISSRGRHRFEILCVRGRCGEARKFGHEIFYAREFLVAAQNIALAVGCMMDGTKLTIYEISY